MLWRIYTLIYNQYSGKHSDRNQHEDELENFVILFFTAASEKVLIISAILKEEVWSFVRGWREKYHALAVPYHQKT